MSDKPNTDTSTSQHTTITTDRHPMSAAAFEPGGERLQTDASDHTATGIGVSLYYPFQILNRRDGDLFRVV